MLHRELLVGGLFLGGVCDQGIGKQVVRNPYDMSIVGTAAESGPAEIEAAIHAASEAYQTWRRSSRLERRTFLRKISQAIFERREELAALAAAEIGKPVTWGLGELDRCALTFEIAADLIGEYGPEARPVDFDPRGGSYSARVDRFPIGPILCITPYNWPFNLAAHKVAPALAAGNTVVLKGSGSASLTTLTLARIIHEAGCPPGVLNTVNCSGAEAEKLARDPRVVMVSFTGSPPVGWHLKEVCSAKRVSLELGGNAYSVIEGDADLEWACNRSALGGFGYAGQICISVQHVIAQSSVYEEVKARMIAATEQTAFGDPTDSKCVCGPLITPEAAVKVMEWLSEAEVAGATILAGGNRIGSVIEPTLVEFPKMWNGKPPKLACQEVFGPIVTLDRYETFDDAIKTVNSSEFGIQTGVFTRDLALAHRAFEELEVGGVVINDYPTLRFDNLPYGGVKRSGFGREGVRYAFDEMTELKSLVARNLP